MRSRVTVPSDAERLARPAAFVGRELGEGVRRNGRGGSTSSVVRVPLRNLRTPAVHVQSLVALVDGIKCVRGVSGCRTAQSGSRRATLLP